jgi:23S rRNA pseudouridine2604 synthase
MPRPTIKVPAKSATTDAEGESRAFSRKPVRAGFTAPKQSVAQRASSHAAKAARLAAAAEKPYKTSDRPRAVPRFKDDAPRSLSPGADQASVKRNVDTSSNRETPHPREVRTPDFPKNYPKRGVARSTGARALPPARDDEGRNPPGPARERFTATPRFEAPPPRPAPVGAPQPRHESPGRPQTAEAQPAKRPLNEPPRLAKQISEMCQCSRREADEWIENGWVRVDGVIVTALGTRVHPNAKIEIKEEASKHQTESVTILLNKPIDMTSGTVDGGGEAALQLIRPENRWAEDETRQNFKATHLRGLALAGKLDPESTGMLVFTQEGSVARRITGDDTRLEKEYMVRVEGELSPEGMKLLNHGLSLDDIKLKRAQVSWQNEQQLRFVLHENKKRQIQRMCELVGLRVTSIKRIRIGSVSLGKLPAGQWRYLREGERF